jgi:hypothetical protein
MAEEGDHWQAQEFKFSGIQISRHARPHAGHDG